jgi:hypothetical protein
MYQFELKNEATFIQNQTQLLPALIATFIPVVVGPAFVMDSITVDIGERKRDR